MYRSKYQIMKTQYTKIKSLFEGRNLNLSYKRGGGIVIELVQK